MIKKGNGKEEKFSNGEVPKHKEKKFVIDHATNRSGKKIGSCCRGRSRKKGGCEHRNCRKQLEEE